jgi:tRNA(His) guanylyltransferase
MAAQACFSHRELQNKSRSEMHEMLFQKGINWDQYPDHFKRGTYVRRRMITGNFTTEEIEALPPKHEARTNPDLTISRNVVIVECFPPLTKIANRKQVILHGAEPTQGGEE